MASKTPALLQIETWPIDRPKPYPRNARIIPPQAVAKVASSLREFGWQQPIVVDKKGVIVVGHTRLLAAKELGMKEVPILIAKKLSAKQIQAYRLADNRTNEESSWDNDLLAEELGDIGDLDFEELAQLTAFNMNEIKSLIQLEDGPNAGPGEFPEVGDDIKTDHECPKCGFKWSGSTQ